MQWNNINKSQWWDYGAGKYVLEFSTDSDSNNGNITNVALTYSPNETFNSKTMKYEIVSYTVTGIKTPVDVSNLENIVIPSSYEGKPVTEIGRDAFKNYIDIKSISLPNSIEMIGESAFADCSGITNLIIPDSVTTISDFAFTGCNSITNLIIPDNVTTIGRSSFSGCIGLKSLTIGKKVSVIYDMAFYGTTALTEISYNAADCKIVKSYGDGNAIFYNAGMNENGITVNIGKNVTQLPEELFYSSFSGKNAPKIITINFEKNSQCKSIGSHAFYSLLTLKDINYNGTISEWNSINKGKNWNYNTGKYTIHCANGDIS